MHDTQPVIVAFDGSHEARAALVAATELFADRRLLVVSVWEPGLALMSRSYAEPLPVGHSLPSPEEIATVDELQREHATTTATAGAELAREHGATAEALPVADTVDVAETLQDVAEQRAAVALVVGTRGLGGVRSRLFGSTARRVLNEAHVPVLVVHPPE